TGPWRRRASGSTPFPAQNSPAGGADPGACPCRCGGRIRKHSRSVNGPPRPGRACPAGCTPMSSSQSPLSPVSVYGENCARSLAPQGHFRAHSVGLGAPPLPTVRGAAGPLIGLAKRETGRARSKEKGAWMRSGAVALRAEGGAANRCLLRFGLAFGHARPFC
ncbi:3-isopropylmalate dehydratase small subunit, partial [Dysosmobacter welbionis]